MTHCTRCDIPLPNSPTWVHAKVDWCCRSCLNIAEKAQHSQTVESAERGMTIEQVLRGSGAGRKHG